MITENQNKKKGIKKKILLIVGSILPTLVMLYLATENNRSLYNMKFDCVEIIDIKANAYKSYPSLTVKIGIEKYEFYKDYDSKHNFLDFRIGDKLCKESKNFNFIRIDKNGHKDTVIYDGYDGVFFKWYYFNTNNKYDESKLDCNCIN